MDALELPETGPLTYGQHAAWSPRSEPASGCSLPEALASDASTETVSQDHLSRRLVQPTGMTQCVVMRSRNVAQRFQGKDSFFMYVQSNTRACRLLQRERPKHELVLVAKRDRKSREIRIFEPAATAKRAILADEAPKGKDEGCGEHVATIEAAGGGRFMFYHASDGLGVAAFNVRSLLHRLEGPAPRSVTVGVRGPAVAARQPQDNQSEKGDNGDLGGHPYGPMSDLAGRENALVRDQYALLAQRRTAKALLGQFKAHMRRIRRAQELEANGVRLLDPGTCAIEGGGMPCCSTLLTSKRPVYANGSYRLDFRGRVHMASVKNFQLVAHPEPFAPAVTAATSAAMDTGRRGQFPESTSPQRGTGQPEAGVDGVEEKDEEEGEEEVLIQFGKVGPNRFTLDFAPSFSASQALCIALTQFLL